jgi:HTH-type transcriptional regulator/antitoxin HigA
MLALLVERYERLHYPIADPDPIEFINHVMESRGLTRKDMEPYIGARGRVADILNRTRPLTLEMIRRLTVELKLPAEVLVKPYPKKTASLTNLPVAPIEFLLKSHPQSRMYWTNTDA